MKHWWRIGLRVSVVLCLLVWLPAVNAQDDNLPEPPVIVDDPGEPEPPEEPGDPDPEEPEPPEEPETGDPEDSDAGAKVDPQRITDLAESFNVEEDTVRDMRTGGMGWGEIDICLRLAENVAGESGDINAALADLRAARTQGRGWGEIAAEYDLKIGQMKKLAPADSTGDPEPEPEPEPGLEPDLEPEPQSVEEPSLERVRSRSRNRIERPEGIDKPDKPDKPGKPDKLDRPDKPDKIGKPERPEKPGKPDKPDKPGKPGKPDKPDKPGRGKP